MLLAIYALTVTALAYAIVEARAARVAAESTKGALMSFASDLDAKLNDQSTKIDAAAARVIAALANVVDPATAAALLAKLDANSAKVDSFAAPAAQPAP